MSIDSQHPQEPSNTSSLPASETTTTDTTIEQAETEIKSETAVETVQKDAQEAALDAMGDMKVYRPGDLIEGTVVQVTDDSLVVDIGTKTEGMINRDEIGISGQGDLSSFAVGDGVKAVVIREDDEGTYHLSKRRADQQLVWEKVEDSAKNGTRIAATVWKAVKGGLLVDIGAIAFLPQSLIDIRRIDDLESMVGEKIEAKVLEFDREAKPHPKIVVSRRSCMEEDLTQERDKMYDSLSGGAITDGKVIKLTNYGAFIDVGGIQGLLHISEMSFGRIKHPSEVMKEGDTIKVKVLKIDKRKKRISLGRRDILPNPWEAVSQKFKPGQVVEGVVVRTADFGAFVKLDEYFEGLAHISELVDNKISHAKEVFNPGDKVNVLIMNIDRKSKRIKLSVKRAAEAERRREVEAFMKEQGDLENVFATRLQEALSDSNFEIAEEEKAEEPAKAEAETETAEAPVVEVEEKTAEVEETPVEEPPVEEPEAVAVEEVTEEATAEPEAEAVEAEAVAEESQAEPEAAADEVKEPEAPAEPEEVEETAEEPKAEAVEDTPTDDPKAKDILEPDLNGTPI